MGGTNKADLEMLKPEEVSRQVVTTMVWVSGKGREEMCGGVVNGIGVGMEERIWQLKRLKVESGSPGIPSE